MAACDILDFQCIIVSEIFGSIALAVVIGLLLYFVVASKLKFGFDTTLLLAIPISLIVSLALGGFIVTYAIAGIIAATIISWVFQRAFGNR
ncbi:hypothetical protein LCGC14_0927210 [marine sediment metagenome]|uniref:Uncharacterized protein n=1 Tax=marine sediment metagenome TaxID=412755 RepID=A0A0F9NTS5_9ZZZZ